MSASIGEPDPPAASFGAALLQRARAHGLTSEELAALLNTPVHRIRAMTSNADLDPLPVATLRTLAEQLHLPLPDWLTPHQPRPDPCESDAAPHDSARVQAVLVLALGQQLHLSEIANILGWSISRAHTAAHRLAARIRRSGGLRLTVAGDALALDVAPHLLSATVRQRLTQVLHAGGLGPSPHVFYLLYHLTRDNGDDIDQIVTQRPDVLDEAYDYQLVTYEHDDANEPVNIRLTPHVQYSLGLIDRLPSTEPDPTSDIWPGTGINPP
ncbi:hypothetical protein [Salinispora arenicola]|uniref:hypothetical protein n=1 Tax=Salinispora arenicola TaxID=168697 RepID=UPI000483DD4E|nr:hypothetical protein [Salinispora arenicola]